MCKVVRGCGVGLGEREGKGEEGPRPGMLRRVGEDMSVTTTNAIKMVRFAMMWILWDCRGVKGK